MNGVGVDASAVIAIVGREAARAEVLQWLRPSPGRRALAPEVLWLELANVLVRRLRFTPSQVVEALRDSDDLGLESVPIDRATLLVAIDLAARLGLSAYDAEPVDWASFGPYLAKLRAEARGS